MYELIQKEIEKQINVYKSDKSRVISDYEKEQETFNDFNKLVERLKKANNINVMKTTFLDVVLQY